MKGDSIVIEAHHVRAAQGICEIILPEIMAREGKYTLTVAGESGSGKSETAAAVAELLGKQAIGCFIFQQDDYFVYPPRSNDRARRSDITWVGPQEVRLDLLDAHLAAFLADAPAIVKPLVIYDEDVVMEEECSLERARVAIAEGTYTTLLENIDAHAFIDRSHRDTRGHRERRARHASELDPFIENVLEIEHGIISGHKARAKIIVNADYSVSLAG
jgi:uridine kinase